MPDGVVASARACFVVMAMRIVPQILREKLATSEEASRKLASALQSQHHQYEQGCASMANAVEAARDLVKQKDAEYRDFKHRVQSDNADMQKGEVCVCLKHGAWRCTAPAVCPAVGLQPQHHMVHIQCAV